MTARHGRLVTAVEPLLRDAWRSAGRGGMLQFVARIEGDEQQVRIRWVWLDDTADNATRPAAPPQVLAGIPTGRLTPVSVRELVGQVIHCYSDRKVGPFVGINCAAIPENLLESELFGHAKGAFTDARAERKGLFQQAQGGTLFLDEIGDFPLSLQAKLLRAMEQRTVRPVGSDKEISFDARILTATNRDLDIAVEEGRYREDFYFRINVIQLDLPPLRARGNDVLLIARSLLQMFAGQMGKNVTDFQTSVAERFLSYDWPGNVRELRNVLERAVALTEFEKLIVDDLPERIRDYRQSTFRIDTSNPAELQTLEAVEQQYIQRVLKSVQGNRTEAARILGVDRKTLYRRLKQGEDS